MVVLVAKPRVSFPPSKERENRFRSFLDLATCLAQEHFIALQQQPDLLTNYIPRLDWMVQLEPIMQEALQRVVLARFCAPL